MGAIIERPGAKGRTRYYLKYIDADGTQRTIAAKGCTKRSQAEKLLTTVEHNIMAGKVGVPKPAAPDPEAERRRSITLQEIGEAFIERFTSPRIKDPSDYRMEAKSGTHRAHLPRHRRARGGDGDEERRGAAAGRARRESTHRSRWRTRSTRCRSCTAGRERRS